MNHQDQNALEFLKADHEQVSTWFDEYHVTFAADKQNLIDRICTALKVHTRIEEEIFYPALRQANLKGGILSSATDMKDDANQALDEAFVEHDGAKKLIAEIEESSVGDPYFDARVNVLSEYVKHHVREEESGIFSAAKRSDLDLVALGARLGVRKRELLASESSASPGEPR